MVPSSGRIPPEVGALRTGRTFKLATMCPASPGNFRGPSALKKMRPPGAIRAGAIPPPHHWCVWHLHAIGLFFSLLVCVWQHHAVSFTFFCKGAFTNYAIQNLANFDPRPLPPCQLLSSFQLPPLPPKVDVIFSVWYNTCFKNNDLA